MEETTKDPIVRRSISISREMDNWLKEHTEINCSSLFRQAVYELQAEDVVKVPLYSLVFFVIIATCFTILLWILLPKQLLGLLTILVLSIVTVVLFKSVILYNKYQEEMKKWKKEEVNFETLLNEKKPLKQNL